MTLPDLPPIVYVAIAIGTMVVALAIFLAIRSRSQLASRPQRIKLPLTTDSNETRNLPGWVWRVPFAVSGSAVLVCVVIPLMYPVNFFTYANATLQIFLTYAFIYASTVVFGARRVAISEAEPLTPSPKPSPFYYAFIVPNYKEDEDVLCETLSNLAAHPYASKQFIVMLAMEDREEGVQAKAERLCKRFAPQLLEVSYSLHELIKGNECPGKASNATAAGVCLSREIRRLHISPARVIVTVMDADTLISPRYVLRLDRKLSGWLAASDEVKVTRQIFTPYMSFSNIDDPSIASIVKATDCIWSMTQIYHITRATPIRFAVSTYSLSLSLLESTGYWEVGDAGIGEDTHEALKVFFATDGEARTVPIYETFRCQCLALDTGGGFSGFVESCRARYKQAARHALGHIDMGYTAYKCWTCTKIPMRLRLVTMLQAFETVYWLMGIMLGWGAALSTIVIYIATYTNPKVCYRGGTLGRVACYHDVEKLEIDPMQERIAMGFAILWLCVTACQLSSSEWLSAHHLRRTPRQWVYAVLKWATTPLVFVLLFVLPGLASHWTLFKKEKLTYAVAPKSAGSTPAGSCIDLEGMGGTEAARSKTNAPSPTKGLGMTQKAGTGATGDGPLALI